MRGSGEVETERLLLTHNNVAALAGVHHHGGRRPPPRTPAGRAISARASFQRTVVVSSRLARQSQVKFWLVRPSAWRLVLLNR